MDRAYEDDQTRQLPVDLGWGWHRCLTHLCYADGLKILKTHAYNITAYLIILWPVR